METGRADRAGDGISTDDALARLLALNLERARKERPAAG